MAANPAPTAPPLDPADTRILDAIEAWESACVAKDVDGMLACLAPNVTWHADLVTLTKDIHGHQPLKAYLAAYPRAYDYEHTPLGRAADGAAGFGFSFAMDQHVVPKADGPHADQAECPPSTTLSLTYLVFERPEAGGGGGEATAGGEGEAGGGAPSEGATSPGAGGGSSPPKHLPLITDVFMQREMSVDEALRRYGAPPADYTRVLDTIPLDALRFGGGGAHDPARAQKHAVAAEALNEAWRTGDAKVALPHLADDFVRVNALTGSCVRGKDAFAAMLDRIFARYELLWHSSCVAVTPGNKAVTFFTAAAQWNDEFCQPSGQSVLLFNDADQCYCAIEFTTPLPHMQAKLLGRTETAEGAAGEVGRAGRGPMERVMHGEAGPPEGEAAAQVAREAVAPAAAKAGGGGAEPEKARTPEA